MTADDFEISDDALDDVAPDRPRSTRPNGLPKRRRKSAAAVVEELPVDAEAPIVIDTTIIETPDVIGDIPDRLDDSVRVDMAIGRPVMPAEELQVRRAAEIATFDQKIRQVCEQLETGRSLEDVQQGFGISDREIMQIAGSPLVESAIGRSQELRRRLAADQVFSLQSDAVNIVRDVMLDDKVDQSVRLKAATTVLKSTGAMTERPTAVTVVQNNLFDGPDGDRFKRRLERLRKDSRAVVDTTVVAVK